MKKFYLFLFTLCITLMMLLQKAGAQCVKPIVISKAATVCPGGTTTLFTKQDPALTYLWSNGGNTASITAGAGTYTLTTTDGGGCSQTSDPVTIKEKALAPVIASDTPVLCPGQSLTLYSDTGNVWIQKTDFPAAAAVRREGIGFSIGSKGYVGAGRSGSTYYSDLWEYDEATETWSQKANIPGSGGRAYAAGIAVNNKGYAGLGNNGTTTFSDWNEFDPFTNTWTTKASYPGGGTKGPAAFAVDNKGYVGLGQHSSGTYPTAFWSYDAPTDTWTPIAGFPGTGRREPVAFGITNKGYVATGWLLGGATNANDCWQYDPATNAWLAQANLPAQGRRTAAAFTIQDHAYIVCGFANVIGITNELWEFYNGAWTKKTSLTGTPQWGPNAFGLHDKAIVCFGSAGTRQVWEYHPNNTVQWPDGSTQLSYIVNTPAGYSATIHDIEGCSINTAPLTVTAAGFTTTPITVSPATTICEGTPDGQRKTTFRAALRGTLRVLH
jgi:N-acetylneuraminic acid mutarotase